MLNRAKYDSYVYNQTYVMRDRHRQNIYAAVSKVAEILDIQHAALYETALELFYYMKKNNIYVPGYMYVALAAAYMMRGDGMELTEFIEDINYIYRVKIKGDGGGKELWVTPSELDKIRSDGIAHKGVVILEKIRRPLGFRINIRKMRRLIASLNLQTFTPVEEAIKELHVPPTIKNKALELAKIAKIYGYSNLASRPKVIALACVAAAYKIITGREPRLKSSIRKVYHKICNIVEFKNMEVNP